MNLINDPGQDRLINELYVWVMVDPATQLEGIVGVTLGGNLVQAVTSSRKIAMQLRDHIFEVAKTTNKHAKLLHFHSFSIVEEGS